MAVHHVCWEVPPLTTASVEAAIRYRDGIAALVSGAGPAEPLLAAAVAIDPDFFLARIGLAVCDVGTGAPYEAPEPAPPALLGRAERQHAEVVQALLSDGSGRHGADLRREHLMEFPGDLLIVWLPSLRLVTTVGAVRAASAAAPTLAPW